MRGTAAVSSEADPQPARDERQSPRRRAAARTVTTPVVLWATLLYLEVMLRMQTGLPVLSLGLVYAALFAGAIAFTVHLVTSFIPGRARAVFVGLFIAAVTIL